MKKFMMTTALGAMAATSALAEAHITQMDNYEASDLMGKRIYAGDASASNDEWNDIGEIDDILITMQGDVPSVIVGVGGFLGMGEKDVALGLDRINVVTGDGGEMFFVVDATQEELEQMEEYESTEERAAEAEMAETEEAADENADAAMDETAEAETEENADMNGTDTEMAETEAEAEAEAAEAEMAENEEASDTMGTPMAAMPAVERDGYANVEREELTTEDLTGARVYDVNDQDIGEIGLLIVGDDGMLSEAVIDVGGFLGLGEKPVAMPMDSIQIMRNEDGSDLRIYVDQTQEQLEAMEEYEG